MIGYLLGVLILWITWWTNKGPPDDPSGEAPLTHTYDEPERFIPNIPQPIEKEIL